MVRRMQKKPLADASPDKCFWVCDGKILKNLKELAEYLEKVPANIFKYHVNKSKNDFADWVTDVFGEAKVSQLMKKSKTAKAMAAKIKSIL